MTALARLSDPDTSATAAESMAEVLNAELERVLDAITFVHEWNGGHGATAHEIRNRLRSQGIDRDQNCVASRCSQLKDPERGQVLIEDRGTRRPGKSSRPLIAWFPTSPEGSA